MHPDERDDHQDSGQADVQPDHSPTPAPREVVSTTDPAIAAGRVGDQPAGQQPTETIVAETSHDSVPKGFVQPSSVGASAGDQVRAKGPNEGRGHEHRPDEKRPARPDRAHWLSYVLTGVVALVCGVGGAWAYSSLAPSKDQDQAEGGDTSKKAKNGDKGSSSKQDSSDSQASGKDEAKSGSSGSMSREDASSGGGDGLKNQVENLSARFEVLRQRVETMSMPRDANPPDVASLRIKVDELSRAIDGMKDLPARSREMETRLDRLQVEMNGLRDRPVAEGDRKVSLASPPIVGASKPEVEPPAPPMPSVKPASPDERLAEGMVLFKKGQYSQAEAIFRGLQQTKPQDARVWYYSALSSGLTTGRWDGEARSLVMQGAERERAGLPEVSVINSTFADLSLASGKEWLASYRSQLVK